MKKTQNSIAGFWIRLLARILDFIFAGGISYGLLFAFIEKKEFWNFKEIWMFYFWCLITSFLFITVFLIIPYFWKGKTIGMFITRIRIIFEKKEQKKFLSLLKRETFFGVAWSMILIFAMIIINHTLVSQFARTNQSNIDYSSFDKLRIGIVTSISVVMMIFQLICAIGVISRNDKQGLHDRLSNTKTVWINKLELVNEEFSYIAIKIPPRLVNNEPIEWVE